MPVYHFTMDYRPCGESTVTGGYEKVTIKGQVDSLTWLICRRNKEYYESRPSYRLKKWFMGLRWVSNWRWRRGCRAIELADDGVTIKYRLSKWLLEQCLRLEGMSSTFVLPDYPSIRELSNKRPVE